MRREPLAIVEDADSSVARGCYEKIVLKVDVKDHGLGYLEVFDAATFWQLPHSEELVATVGHESVFACLDRKAEDLLVLLLDRGHITADIVLMVCPSSRSYTATAKLHSP